MSDQAATNGPDGSQTTASEQTVIGNEGSDAGNGIEVAGPLSEENRALIEAKKWAKDGKLNANALADGYREVAAHASKALTVPGKDATQEDWDKFYKRAGRPDSAEAYELKLNPEAVPENFPYDEQSAVEFRNWALEAGLNQRQASILHDKFVANMAGTWTEGVEANRKAEGDAHRAIVDEWGDTDSTLYKENAELMSRAVLQLGLKDALASKGLLSDDGVIRDAKLAFAFAKVGREMYGEDSLETIRGGVLQNPFSPEHEDTAKQTQLIRNDPKRARSLMVAAGVDPKEYQM